MTGAGSTAVFLAHQTARAGEMGNRSAQMELDFPLNAAILSSALRSKAGTNWTRQIVERLQV